MPPYTPVAKYISMSLRKVSEQASWTTWLTSQKKWGISKSVQKGSHNTIMLCIKEFRALMIQDSKTSSPQTRGFMMTV